MIIALCLLGWFLPPLLMVITFIVKEILCFKRCKMVYSFEVWEISSILLALMGGPITVFIVFVRWMEDLSDCNKKLFTLDFTEKGNEKK